MDYSDELLRWTTQMNYSDGLLRVTSQMGATIATVTSAPPRRAQCTLAPRSTGLLVTAHSTNMSQGATTSKSKHCMYSNKILKGNNNC